MGDISRGMLSAMVEIAVRPARADDTGAVARIHVEAWQATYPGFMPDEFLANLSVERRRRHHEETLLLEDRASFVGTVNGTVRGFATVGGARHELGDVDVRDGWGELQAIYVHPDAHGFGLGSLLEAEGRAWLRDAGFRRAYLWVVSGNTQAEVFYASKGWRPDGVRQIFEVPGADVPEHRLVIDLT